VQGFATGLATATLGAMILDTDRSRGPLLNSITAFGGLNGRKPGRRGACHLCARSAAARLCRPAGDVGGRTAAILLVYAGGRGTKPGALASLQPHVYVAGPGAAALVQVTPVTIAIMGACASISR